MFLNTIETNLYSRPNSNNKINKFHSSFLTAKRLANYLPKRPIHL